MSILYEGADQSQYAETYSCSTYRLRAIRMCALSQGFQEHIQHEGAPTVSAWHSPTSTAQWKYLIFLFYFIVMLKNKQ